MNCYNKTAHDTSVSFSNKCDALLRSAVFIETVYSHSFTEV